MNEKSKQPTGREILDHVRKKRAEGYRPKRSVYKSENRRSSAKTPAKPKS